MNAPPPAYPALVGFRNETGSSCFVDSVLLAIVGPYIVFYDRASNKPANQNFNKGAGAYFDADKKLKFTSERFLDGLVRERKYPTLACNSNPDFDMTLRTNIRLNIYEIYKNLKSGQVQTVCTNLRTTLGRHCRLHGTETDFSVGQHDVIELYSRILSAMSYYPMTVRYLRKFTSSQGDEPYQSLSDAQDTAQYYVKVEEAKKQLLGNWTRDTNVDDVVKDGVKYQMMSETILFDRVDTFVVYIDRIVNNEFDSRKVVVDPNVSLCVQSDGYQTLYQNYALLSFVYRTGTGKNMNAGHFATMLAVPTSADEYKFTQEELSYYDYDDTSTQTKRITREEFFQTASTRGVLFFYFPYGSRGQACQRENNQQEPVTKRVRIDQLVEAGYDKSAAESALEQAKGDVNKAFHLLMDGNY